jgi:hypothetical protein
MIAVFGKENKNPIDVEWPGKAHIGNKLVSRTSREIQLSICYLDLKNLEFLWKLWIRISLPIWRLTIVAIWDFVFGGFWSSCVASALL